MPSLPPTALAGIVKRRGHDVSRFAADEKPHKAMARDMMRMNGVRSPAESALAPPWLRCSHRPGRVGDLRTSPVQRDMEYFVEPDEAMAAALFF